LLLLMLLLLASLGCGGRGRANNTNSNDHAIFVSYDSGADCSTSTTDGFPDPCADAVSHDVGTNIESHHLHADVHAYIVANSSADNGNTDIGTHFEPHDVSDRCTNDYSNNVSDDKCANHASYNAFPIRFSDNTLPDCVSVNQPLACTNDLYPQFPAHILALAFTIVEPDDLAKHGPNHIGAIEDSKFISILGAH